MKWIDIKKEKPRDYDWVIVGYWNEEQGDELVWTIARWWPTEQEFQFRDSNDDLTYGPYSGDAFWDIRKKDITHWFYVETDKPELI